MPEEPPRSKARTSRPKPLAITCTSSDCERQLHCFRATRKLKEMNAEGICRACGIDLIDWGRVHSRNLDDAAFTFASLRNELIRHHFWHVEIDERAVNHARRKGWIRLHDAVENRIRRSVGPATPPRDGYQTPREGSGNSIYYAQHATASCCRRCIEEWHAVPMGRELTEAEIHYLVELAMFYLRDRLPNVTTQGERVPNLRRAS
jgi:hypothetical protein